jgi:hypothetical protein
MFYKSKGCVQTTQPFFYSCVEIKFYEGIYRVFELKIGVRSGKSEKLSKNRISGHGEACSDLLTPSLLWLICHFQFRIRVYLIFTIFLPDS